MLPILLKVLAALVLVANLQACGAGGGGSANPTAEVPQPEPEPEPEPDTDDWLMAEIPKKKRWWSLRRTRGAMRAVPAVYPEPFTQEMNRGT